jgi:hypothetical protein
MIINEQFARRATFRLVPGIAATTFGELQMESFSYHYDFDDIKNRFVVNLSGEISPDRIHQTFLDIISDDRGSSQYRNIIWLLQKAIVPTGLTYVDILEDATTIRNSFPIGLTAIVVDPNSSIQKTVSDYYKNIAIMKTQRVVQVFNSMEEAEAWFEDVL